MPSRGRLVFSRPNNLRCRNLRTRRYPVVQESGAVTIAPVQLSGSTSWTDARLLQALEEVVEVELDRHLKVAKEWMPHEYVPWSQGRDFDGVLGGEAWDLEQSKVTAVGRVSLVV